MRVSVTLHRKEPDLDGNQRDVEARYCGYNRAYADLHIDENGDGFVDFKDLEFPPVQADGETLTHFSIGVCVAPLDQGGAIINAGPLHEPIVADVGMVPRLSAKVGVHKARLDEMRADGRLFE